MILTQIRSVALHLALFTLIAFALTLLDFGQLLDRLLIAAGVALVSIAVVSIIRRRMPDREQESLPTPTGNRHSDERH